MADGLSPDRTVARLPRPPTCCWSLGVCTSNCIGVNGQHAEGGVAVLPVVPDLDVVEHCVGQLNPGRPALTVKELDLHP